MTWAADVVDELAQLKAQGLSFDEAWARAIAAHPPLSRDKPAQDRGTLFEVDETGDIELSPAEFLRGACDDAWHGRKPVLQHVAALLFRDEMTLGPATHSVHLGRGGRSYA